MRPELYSKLRDEGLPMRVLAIDRRCVIVSRHEEEPPLLPKPAGKLLTLLQ